MIVAALTPQTGTLRVIDRLREPVRLAAGLTPDEKRIDMAAQQRAVACLERFAERLREIDPGSVRAIGTNTLRRARASEDLLPAAEHALGQPIEVVSGFEEARLIYLGVAHSLGFDQRRRLVVDIGGGSTELILGEGSRPLQMESLHLGCVALSTEFFAEGRVSEAAMAAAVLHGRLELGPITAAFGATAWQAAVGASGTVKAVAQVCAALYGDAPGVVSASSLERLVQALIKEGECRRLATKAALSTDRQPVFVGGVAALKAVFEALSIEQMEVADGAMREGILYDLGGRAGLVAGAEDARDASVAALRQRYSVDAGQAERIRATALRLYAQIAEPWGLTDPLYHDMLDWAAQLHEIGLDISHAQYHKHGAYILTHADLAGFSRQEQALLAVLVRVHRRKLARTPRRELPARWQEPATRLALLLRLAVLLHRSRSDAAAPEPELDRTAKRVLTLTWPASVLADNPLLRADLAQEARYLERAGWRLEVVSKSAC
ncbi:exopolyphosphatase [Halorhodospira abdelmalekii]|nr:Ppx/GppA phosphatase family protein [Halorhodospira abdelmalekii]MBK1733827.1 exopolyphosphatase [Halorhodospira abdelmalekii]